MKWWLVTPPGILKRNYATGGIMIPIPRDHVRTNSEELARVKLNTRLYILLETLIFTLV